MSDDAEVRQIFAGLADDEVANENREAACQAIAQGLVRLGQALWVQGALLGPDRASGESPFRFGDDRVVGVATVSQIGGELATAADGLLRADQQYAASALVRQLVEVEYLAAAFAEEHEIAAEWLRADRQKRRDFWSPAQLRKRAEGRFLREDYWDHCDRGGHPATPGMSLLPDHEGFHVSWLWADLAGHLEGIWKNTCKAAKLLLEGPIPDEFELPDVQTAIERWLETDRLFHAIQSFPSPRHEAQDS